MNKKLLKLCLCACAAFGINACDTGEHNNLECTESYVADCLSGDAYMTCNNGTLKVVYCEGNDVCTPRPEGAICAPRGDEAPSCVTACAQDGVTLKKCKDDGTADYDQIDCRTVQEGFICLNAQCQARPTGCTNSCLDDGVTLVECQADGSTIERLCTADGHEGYTCGLSTDGSATCLPPTLCEASCDANDPNLLHSCDENGQPIDVVCSDKGAAFTCRDNACVETCTENVCDSDGLTLKSCNSDGIVELVDCSDSDEICSHGQCVAPSSIVGVPCHCEGTEDECTLTYTGAQFKELITEKGAQVFETYYNSIDEDDVLVGPNFYSDKNVGCEDLQAYIESNNLSGIMTAACYQSFEVVKPASIINIIGNDFVDILDGYLTDTQTDFFKNFADSLNEFNFASEGGYCMPVVLDMHATVDGRVKETLKQELLTKDGGAFPQINTADHEQLLAKVANGDNICPSNSTFFSYELNKNARRSATLFINFDMCLQNCSSDDDCRDDYTCQELSNIGLKSDDHLTTDPASGEVVSQKICFQKDNIDDFTDMKAKLNEILSILTSKL